MLIYDNQYGTALVLVTRLTNTLKIVNKHFYRKLVVIGGTICIVIIKLLDSIRFP
ncbi:malic enzyme [Cerasibacillus quisquiliarum]|uniref:hypothetical protein n=1 Tax=Cerasibacillus quisquiliarum TaxID=227865 RepID=UPI0014770A2B|nr:hypothetical protein [Cerasibacillus quisquiliarum]MBB5145713.1 malic enzyme [Cerasibacillus quisquiliarum]